GADVKVSHAQCSMAKLYSAEMAGRVADRAVQVFGGRGYMRENVAERFFRELRVERIWEGTSEIQRMIIARQMTKRTPAALAQPKRWPGQAPAPTGSTARCFRNRLDATTTLTDILVDVLGGQMAVGRRDGRTG